MKKMFDTADGRTGAADPSAGALKRELRKQVRRTRDAIDPAVRAAWSERFGEPDMKLTSYQDIFAAFNTKFLGFL